MATRQIKVYTLTNKLGKKLTINGITNSQIVLDPEETVEVRPTEFVRGWSDKLNTYGRYVGISTTFKDLVNPTFAISPDPTTVNFTNGSDRSFKVKITSKDYLGDSVKFKMGTDVEDCQFYIKDPVMGWQDSTNGVLVFLDKKTKTLDAKVVIGTEKTDEAVKATISTSLLTNTNSELGSQEFEVTSTPVINDIITTFAKTTLDSGKFTVGEATEFTYTIEAGNQEGVTADLKFTFSDPSVVSKLEYSSGDDSWTDVESNTVSGLTVSDSDLKFRITFASAKQTYVDAELTRSEDGVLIVATRSLVVPIEPESSEPEEPVEDIEDSEESSEEIQQ